MPITLLNSLILELDEYLRAAYVQHITDVPPEFTVYTKEEKWPKNGNLLAPFIRAGQFPTIGPAPVKPEHVALSTQQLRAGRSKDVYPVRFATAVGFSYEKTKMGADVYSSAKKPGQFLADAQRLTYEIFYSDIFTNATNTAAPGELLGYDGLPMLHTAHVLLSGDTASNVHSGVSNITYTTLNTVLTAIARTVNEENRPMPILRGNTMWIPPEEEAAAYETITSMGRPDTAQRADNILAQRLASGLTKDSVQVLLWMPATNWYVVDSSAYELNRYTLEAPQVKGPIVDDFTHDITWQISFWIARAMWDWRGIYGVPRP